MKISKIKPNESNPRFIKDDKFEQLCLSIQSFPKMMELRPIIIDEHNVIQGGNMRYRALKHLGYKDIPDAWVKQVKDLSEEEKKEFIIKDNIGYGEWDWDILANDFEASTLSEWGLTIPNWINNTDDLTDFFNDQPKEESDTKNKIVLEYTDDDYAAIVDAFSRHNGTREQVVYKLLVV